jgi:hypothetical protein
MKNVIYLLCFSLCSTLLNAQQPQKFYYVGHSLINLNIPFMVQEMAQAANKPADYRHHINIGAPLRLNWDEPWKFNGDLHWVATLGREVEHGTDFSVELPRGGYTALVLTEAQSFQSNLMYNDGIGHGRKFDELARRASPNVKTYCYETWNEVKDSNYAAWRQTINVDRPFWEKMAGGIRPDSLIVPGGQAMAALYDALLRGPVGRLTNISQVFNDNIHLTNTGNYYIALVMYATLFKMSPEGLPDVSSGPFQQSVRVETDAATRLALQRLAWQVVRSYRLANVTVSTAEVAKKRVIIAPNPTNGQVFLKNTEGVVSIDVLDMQGQLHRRCVGEQVIDLSNLTNGMYVLLVRDKEKTFALKVNKM